MPLMMQDCKCESDEWIPGPEKGTRFCATCKKSWRKRIIDPLDDRFSLLTHLAKVMHADIVRLESMVCYMMDRQFDDLIKQPTTDQARRLKAMGEEPWKKLVIRASWFEQWQAAYQQLQAERAAQYTAAEEPPTEDKSDGQEKSNSEQQAEQKLGTKSTPRNH